MRFRREHSKDQRRRDLEQRREALTRELAAAEAASDVLEQAIALNNLGTASGDMEEWDTALEQYQRAATLVPADAELSDRATPHGNAANAARRLKQWDVALRHAVWVDALAATVDPPDEAQRQIANAAVALVRRALEPDAFATELDAAVAALPEELRAGVRRDQHLNPTVVNAERPGRNEPCWCGSGKKYKHCHLSTDATEN